jgi:hypothetical protein
MGKRFTNLGKKLGLMALATIACLCILEVAFRVAGYRALYDIYSKPEIFWRHDPLLGWSMEPNVNGDFIGPRPFPVEFHSHVRINSLGLRGAEITPVVPAGFRMLVLGDSLVAGFEVEESQTFEAILARDLSAELGVEVQVINAGVRGYGTDQALLYYRERGRSLRPHLVMFMSAANDLEDNTTLHRARRPFGKGAFSLEPDGSLQTVGFPIPEYPFCSGYRLNAQFMPVRIDGRRERMMCWVQTTLSDHSALFSFATLRIQQNVGLVYRLFALGTPDQQATIMPQSGASTISPAGRLTTAIIREMAALARSDSAQFLFATNPYDLVKLDERALEDGHFDILNRAVTSDDPKISMTFRADSHLNERGHARFAELLHPIVLRILREIGQARNPNPSAGAVIPDAANTAPPVPL